MTPKYLHHLANLADSTELWKQPHGTPRSMAEQSQLDAGVALRRYADHLQTLAGALGRKQSVLITPLTSNSTAVKAVVTPPDHERLRPEGRAAGTLGTAAAPAPTRWCPECRSAGVVGIEQDVCPTCDGTGKIAAGVAGTFDDQQEKP